MRRAFSLAAAVWLACATLTGPASAQQPVNAGKTLTIVAVDSADGLDGSNALANG